MRSSKIGRMLNKLPLFAVILAIVFLITSLLTFIATEKVITPEKNEVIKQSNANVQISINQPPKTESGNVLIDIVQKK